jgi:hypothetical protein
VGCGTAYFYARIESEIREERYTWILALSQLLGEDWLILAVGICIEEKD